MLVHCPVQVLQEETCRKNSDPDLGLKCDWTGELGDVDKHLIAAHKDDKRWKICCPVNQPETVPAVPREVTVTSDASVAIYRSGKVRHVQWNF